MPGRKRLFPRWCHQPERARSATERFLSTTLRKPFGFATTIEAKRRCKAGWGKQFVSEAAILAPPAPEVVHGRLAARSGEVDARVLDAFSQTLQHRVRSGLALLAVGGFGRRELFPRSDVDLLLLTAEEAPPKDAISAFLQTLWDGGLRPSHSVHTIAECVTEHTDNAELTISLLDRRFLAGDQTLYHDLDERFRSFLSKRGPAIAQQICGLAEGRRAKF